MHFNSLYDKELWDLDIIETQTVATPRINGSIELKDHLYSKDNNIYVNVSGFDSDKFYLNYPMYTYQIEKYNQLYDDDHKFKKKI